MEETWPEHEVGSQLEIMHYCNNCCVVVKTLAIRVAACILRLLGAYSECMYSGIINFMLRHET